eukprot:COSAG02_NODE_15667_length_1150_cov_1.391056_1_plen_71_part_10
MVIDGVGYTGQVLGLLTIGGVSPAAAGHGADDSATDDGLEQDLLRRQSSGGTQEAKQASQGEGTAWHQAAM